jgi:hypothetical protein
VVALVAPLSRRCADTVRQMCKLHIKVQAITIPDRRAKSNRSATKAPFYIASLWLDATSCPVFFPRLLSVGT